MQENLGHSKQEFVKLIYVKVIKIKIIKLNYMHLLRKTKGKMHAKMHIYHVKENQWTNHKFDINNF